ncbi:MAG: DUF167 domain-containing protein [Chitinophagaceae bacterium]|nr:DUF167 domain-containing protein [Chitinophagaceae bacterium]
MAHENIRGNILNVRVTPRASSNRIQVIEQPDGTQLIRVYVTVPPEDGKANDAVIKLLAKELDIAQSSLTILSGHTSRNKKIRML